MATKKKLRVFPEVSVKRNESIHRSIGDERSKRYLLSNPNGRIYRLDHPHGGVTNKTKRLGIDV